MASSFMLYCNLRKWCHIELSWVVCIMHEGHLALTANSLIPDRWTKTKQASPLHTVWRQHFIWDFFNLICMPQFSKNLNKLDFVHFKREYDVLCFWNMNYSCTFSNLQKEWINLTEFQQNYRYISKHAYFTFLNKIMPLGKNIWLLCPVLPHWYIASNESLDVPVTKSRNTKLLQICGSSEIWCKSSVYSGKFRVLNLEHLRDSSCRQMFGLAFN